MANTASIVLSSAANQFIELGGSTGSLNSFRNGFTLELWIKMNGRSFSTLIAKDGNRDGGAANRQFILQQVARNGINQLLFGGSTDGNTFNAANYFATDIGSYFGKWTHIAVTFQVNQQRTLYINGQLVEQSGTGSIVTLQDTNVSVRVGVQGYSNLINFYDGQMDDIRLWNVVRTAAQILANYQRELIPAQESGNGLVEYLKLNSSYTDAMGNFSPGPNGLPSFTSDVPFADATTTSTSTTTTSTSTSSTSTSTSSSTTTTSTSTTTTSTSTSTTTTITSTSTSRTTTSTSTTTSTTTTLTSTSSTTTTSTSSSTSITIPLRFMVEKVR